MTDLTLFGASPLDPADKAHPRIEGFLDFHGELIPVLVNERGHWASVTRLCKAMSIDPEGQRQAILRKHWSEGMTFKTQVMLPGQSRAYPNFFIHEKRLPMWLANIETDRLADPEVRTNVERTQTEFADVLAEWVATGQVRPAAQPAIPQSFAEALELAAKQAREIEAQTSVIERQAEEIAVLEPKAEAHDAYQSANGGHLVREVAKSLRQVWPDLKVADLFNFLVAERFLFRRSGTLCGENMYDAQSNYVPVHFLVTTSAVRHNRFSGPCAHTTVHVTSRGLELIRKRIAARQAELVIPATPQERR